MTPEHVFDEQEFAEVLARTPPPAGDSRACHWSCLPGDSTEPEERKPASVWDLWRWFWGGR